MSTPKTLPGLPSLPSTPWKNDDGVGVEDDAEVGEVKPEPLLLLFLQCHTQSQVDYRLHLDLGISELIAMTDFRMN